MIKKLKIEGLNCATCADKIEIKLKSIPWIDDVDLNITMGNLFVKINNGNDYSIPKIQNIIDDIEDGVFLSDESVSKNKSSIFKNVSLIKIIISLPLFIMGLLINDNFTLKTALLLIAYFVSAYEVLLRSIKNILKGDVFDEFFLMSLATIGAFIIGEISEGVGVMIFFQIGEFLQDLAVDKSKKSIQSLMNLKPEFVRLLSGETISPELVKIGDEIEIRPGEKVPLDGIIINGSTSVDTKTITGESQPTTLIQGDEILSGYINISHTIKVRIQKELSESTVSKILEMVQNESSKKSETETFITKFAKVYTPIVVISAVLVAVTTPFIFKEWTFSDSIYKSLIFLVISCPCALVISVPLGYFSGIGRASKEGILIKGSNHLEALSLINKYAFDKTGTLTQGKFTIVDIIPSKFFTTQELNDVAKKSESKSNHPLAKAINKGLLSSMNYEPDKFEEIPGKGTFSWYNSDIYIAGRKNLLIENGIKIEESLGDEELTTVYFGKNQEYIGKITLDDKIKPDVPKMIRTLGPENVYMLTGDKEETAHKIGKEAGIVNINHSLLPLDKANIIKELNLTSNVLFVGDGINDSPVLAASSVGVSMGGLGSDAAIEASDIVIMSDEPSKIISAIKIAKFTKGIILGNIFIALGFKILIMVLGLTGLAGLWLAIFADVGVSILAVLNSIRTLKLKID